MPTAIEKLISIGSGPLGPPTEFSGKIGVMGTYLDLLSQCNGFYAFESALLVRPGFIQNGPLFDSRSWNKDALWKETYGSLRPDAVFFSEDISGNQFGIQEEHVVIFEAETGEINYFSDSIEEWASKVLSDYNLHAGYPLARDWQKIHGALTIGNRLIFKQPLILGGAVSVENLIGWNDLRAMRARGAFAEQVKNVPDGGQVSFTYVD